MWTNKYFWRKCTFDEMLKYDTLTFIYNMNMHACRKLNDDMLEIKWSHRDVSNFECILFSNDKNLIS